MNDKLSLFATTPKYISELLAEELKSLGAEITSIKLAGVAFQGNLETAYRACLWSRLANRILLPLANFDAPTPEALYAGMQKINWSEHFNINNTFAIDFSCNASQITHTQYGAQKAKDAVVDQFRDKFGERPTVQLDKPDLMINIYLHRDIATVSIDLAGESLHKRGYRSASGEAPLKENLAAAILIRAGWPKIAEQGGSLVDLMCGVGTLPIEAALMAGNIAPGLFRDYFGFEQWKHHQAALWENLKQEARGQQKNIPLIIGYDADTKVIRHGLDNLANAGLQNVVHLEKRELANFKLNQALQKNPGLVIVNPPYGERLGEADALHYLYKNIGDQFKQYFTGWQGAVFTGNPELGKAMAIHASKYYAFFNGPIPCRLLLFSLQPENFFRDRQAVKTNQSQITKPVLVIPENDPIQMFINRLKKNMKHIQRWAEREHIYCYRIYDADLPEYAVAIDRYEQWVHIQEYAPPKTIDPQKAEQRLQAMINILPAVLNIPAENIFYKIRHKQSRKIQYEKLSEKEQLFTIREGQAKFLVNLSDYVDTGLFLDQRIVRANIQAMAKGKHFLNLFGYTGTATVAAIIGNAASTTTVDLSATYLRWAKKNLALNGFSEQRHHFIQADCIPWIQEQEQQYDLIFVAPPVFSRSKRMAETFDIQRDHLELLVLLKNNLRTGGKMIFATHKKGFTLDAILTRDYQIEDWSKKTLPLDFQRNTNAYHCWVLERRA